MTLLEGKIVEAEAVMWAIKVYAVAIDLIVGFLGSAIIFQTIGINMAYSIFPAILYALYRLYLQYTSRSIVSKLDGKYEDLGERLATALEYRSKNNIIVSDLMSDVTKRMDSVESSTFLDSKQLSKKIYTIVVLSFLLLTVTVLDARSFAFDKLGFILDAARLREDLQHLSSGNTGTGLDALFGDRWEQSNWTTENEKDKLGAESGGEQPGINEGPLPGTGGGTGAEPGKDIFGDASSAAISGKDMDFKLHPEYGGDIEIRETGGRKTTKEFTLNEVSSVEECVECAVGPENEEMVRRYFEKIIPDS